MNAPRPVKRGIPLLLCVFALLLAPLAPVYAEEAEAVRVGFFAFDGYHMRDDSGNLSGYGYDILRNLAGYADLSFEFVGYDKSWSEAQEMLAAGELDLLTSAQKTPEREARFDFSDRPIGVSSAILTVNAGNTKYILDDCAHWSGMRVGMIEGNSRNDRFAEYAAERGFSYTPVYYGDTDAMLRDLKGGIGIDAMITSNLRRMDGEWILAQFDPSPFYVMVRKGDSALLERINRALDLLYAAMPQIDTLLMDKYYPTHGGESIAFTVEERAVIDATAENPITVGVISSAKPICYFDVDQGEYIGISMDILRAVGNKTGLRFDFQPIDLTQNTPVGWLKAGRFDMVAGIIRLQTFADDAQLALSDAVLMDSIVMVGRSGDDFTKSAESKAIAVLKGFQAGMAYVAEQFPNHKIVTFDTFDACMDAVTDGRADATVYMRACASYSLQNPHYDGLEIVPAYAREITTCMAVLSGNGALLMGIVDKGLAMIADTERNAIMMSYTILNPYQPSLEDALYEYRIPLVIIALLVLCVLAVLMLMLSIRRRSAKKLTEAFNQAKTALARAEEARAQSSKALRAAENANAAKSQFLSRVSHEMRTPLNAIMGFIQLAKDAKPEEIQSYLASTDTAAHQLLAVINDVLDMSAIEAGKMTLSYAPFDFAGLVRSVASIYSYQCRQKGLNFVLEMPDMEANWLVGDKLRTNQVLFNLLSNAVKFTREGCVRLGVSQTRLGAQCVTVRMEVADTGCGMSEDMLGRLFKPFEQESGATAVQYGGSGLGLSICKGYVAAMGGAIFCESAPGKGARFVVEIPFERSDAPASPEAVTVSQEAGDSFHGLRALLCEDNEVNRRIAQKLLEKAGFLVETAGDGKEGFEKFAASPKDSFSVIYMDIQMPVMDGYEAAAAIRRCAHPQAASIPIIAMTANVFSEDVARSKAAGMNGHVAKPIDIHMLFSTTRQALFPPRAHEASAPTVSFKS